MEAVIVSIVLFVLGALILHWIIRRAIISSLRQARHEARVEQHLPQAATWLSEDERRLLDISKTTGARTDG